MKNNHYSLGKMFDYVSKIQNLHMTKSIFYAKTQFNYIFFRVLTTTQGQSSPVSFGKKPNKAENNTNWLWFSAFCGVLLGKTEKFEILCKSLLAFVVSRLTHPRGPCPLQVSLVASHPQNNGLHIRNFRE